MCIGLCISLVAQSYLTLCHPMDCSTPGFHHQLLELAQVVSIESVRPFNHLILCRPLLLLPSIFPSIGVFSNESSFFKSGGQSIGAPSFSINPSNDYSGLISFRIDWFDLLAVSLRDFEESSPTRQFKSINSLVLSFFYGPTLTSVHIIYIYVILLIYSGCAWPSLLCRLFSSCSKQELPST